VAVVSEPATDRPVVLRLGTVGDAPAAAALHASLISEGFLASLGPRFLCHLYRRVARDPGSFLLVAEVGGSVAGFLAGSVDLRALYRRFVLRDGVTAGVSVLPRLLGALPRVWETLRHGGGGEGSGGDGSGGEGSGGAADSGAGSGSDGSGGAAELLSVAVGPAWQGRHIGVALVDRFLAESERRGARAAQVVVGADNAPAIALYRRAGFSPARTFELHRGTASLLLRRHLP